MNLVEKRLCFATPLAGIFNIEADLHQKGEKVGAIGLEPTTSRM
jgi:hypothetical protein